jgi:hypothetical protein
LTPFSAALSYTSNVNISVALQGCSTRLMASPPLEGVLKLILFTVIPEINLILNGLH